LPEGEDPVKLLLADHDPLVRRAVRDGLSDRGELLVVGEVADADELLAATETAKPAVVLLDPDLDPGAATITLRRLTGVSPATRVVLFAVRDDPDVALEALQAGAAGYLTKDINMESLARALQGIAAGEAAITRRMTTQVLEKLRSLSSQLRRMRPVRGPLSNRQWQVLDLLAQGHAPDEVARILRLSPDTVRTHTRGVLQRLRVGSVAEAIEVARRLRSEG
jgi:DNA-binding NarL/FixJ family response regulator